MLKYLPFPLDESKSGQKAFPDEASMFAAARADEAFFITYHAYLLGGKVFKEGAGAKQRDIMKCFSLFQMVLLRAFIKHQASILDSKEFDASKSAKFILDRLQKLKFVTSTMIKADDLHIDQFLIALKGALDYGKAVLDKCQITDDYNKIIESIENPAPEFRGASLKLDNLSVFARGCLEDFSKDGAYRKFLSADFLEVHEALQQRPPELWLTYDLFEKTFKKDGTPAQDAPAGSTGAQKSDVEMKQEDSGADARIYFNLQQLHDKSFEIATKVLKPVIHKLHARCIQSTKAKELNDDKALEEFCAKTYGI